MFFSDCGVVLLCLWATAVISLLDLDHSFSQLDSAKLESTTGRVETREEKQKAQKAETTVLGTRNIREPDYLFHCTYVRTLKLLINVTFPN